MKFFSYLFLLAFLLNNSACFEQGELGTASNPIKLYFTPSVDADTITSSSTHFLKFLEKETGYYFESGIPASYVAVVEAFGSGRADIGVINSFAYLMANEKYGAEAKLKVIRHGLDHYRGQIIAHKDSGINTVKDINGKKFAYTDPSSTSGYMFAKKILKEENAVPSNTTFAVKHDNVVTMVYQKQVDAGATYYSPPAEDGKIRDARSRVKTQFPDVEEKVKLITITEKIPNDPFVFRKDLKKEISDKFITAVQKYLDTTEGKEAFKKMYSVEGVVPAQNSDYEGLRAMIKAIDLDTEKLVK